MLKKHLKLFAIALTVLNLGFSSISSIKAISPNELSDSNSQTVTIDNTKYTVNINNDFNQRTATVTDKDGYSTTAIYDKSTDKLIINDQEIQIEELNTPSFTALKAANKVLKRTTYTIPGGVTSSVAALTAGLAAISNLPFATAIIAAYASGNLWGKPLKITITNYRSGTKCSSGSYKGKYKYLTNVLAKCGKSTLLNQNHSVYYK